jgi:hypothetical protein
MESIGRSVLDIPQEPVIGLAEGETRWRGMTLLVLFENLIGNATGVEAPWGGQSASVPTNEAMEAQNRESAPAPSHWPKSPKSVGDTEPLQIRRAESEQLTHTLSKPLTLC